MDEKTCIFINKFLSSEFSSEGIVILNMLPIRDKCVFLNFVRSDKEHFPMALYYIPNQLLFGSPCITVTKIGTQNSELRNLFINIQVFSSIHSNYYNITC